MVITHLFHFSTPVYHRSALAAHLLFSHLQTSRCTFILHVSAQYPSSYFPSESFHSYFGLFRKTNAYQLQYVIKMTATGDSNPKTCFCRYWEYIFMHTILQPAYGFWTGCSLSATLKPIMPSFPIQNYMLKQD